MKLLTEFVGSFLFMFAIALAASGGAPLAPLAIGGALMVMVYMGGHISGGHYNPAVSLAATIRGALDAKDLVPYWAAQVLGSIAAFLTGKWILSETVPIAPTVDTTKALVVEAIFTLALCLVVLNVATAKKTSGRGFYGLAIGFTIVVAAIAGGPVSGGAFNPAVATGAAMADGNYANLWIYWVGPLVGGVVAALIFKAQGNGGEEPAA